MKFTFSSLLIAFHGSQSEDNPCQMRHFCYLYALKKSTKNRKSSKGIEA